MAWDLGARSMRSTPALLLALMLLLGASACGSDPAPTGWACSDNSPTAQAASCMCVNAAASTTSGTCSYTACCVRSSQGGDNLCECFDTSFLAAFDQTCQDRLNIRIWDGFASVYLVPKCPP